MADDLFNFETEAQAQYKRELERSSRDRIRVYNPTSEDFDVYNDGYRWTVPGRDHDTGSGNGQAVFPRYLAITFVTNLCNKIFFDKMDAEVKAENERRVKAGFRKMEKWAGEEQERFESQFAPTTPENQEKRRQLMQIMWMGIEEEYGILQKVRPNQPKNVTDEEFLRKLSSRRAATTPTNGSVDDILSGQSPQTPDVVPSQPPQSNLDDKSLFELRSVAKEKGVEYELTTKKEELLAKLRQ